VTFSKKERNKKGKKEKKRERKKERKKERKEAKKNRAVFLLSCGTTVAREPPIAS